MKENRIIAIITCYFPDITEITRLIESVRSQVASIIIIDNGGMGSIQLPDDPNILIMNSGQNLGTAGGYNLGAVKAWSLGASHILLLDQDSECAPNMVEKLVSAENLALATSKKVAVVGPYYICKSNQLPAPFITHSGYRIQRHYKSDDSILFLKCSYVISSGSLISKTAWDLVGPKNENLFLDFTDIEWGLRAESKGLVCIGSFEAIMWHLIGDEQLELLGRKISLHSPLRHYYAFRNCVWLAQQSFVPFGTRVNYLMKLAPKILIYSLFSKEPWSQIKFMINGILDGVRGQMGIYHK